MGRREKGAETICPQMENLMLRRVHWLTILMGVVVAVIPAVVGLGIAVYPQLRERLLASVSRSSPGDALSLSPQLVAGARDTIQLPAAVARESGIQTAVAEPATQAMSLELSGTLILDSDRLSHVHARFAGEVVEFGPVELPANAGTTHGGTRGLDFGDPVHTGQLLAVIWSRELGEKKSELVDALSQLRVDEETLARLTRASAEGAVSDRTTHDAERKVESDRIAEARIVRTLETWRVPKPEIDAIRAEAARFSSSKGTGHTREELVHQWARLEVRSPLDGVILEKNIALNDLVDTNLDLFKIADLSRLRVIAHAYEEDLPLLDAIPLSDRRWTIRVGTNPKAAALPGQFDQIGRIIDPNQHTAMVMGWAANADGRLRVGQFITATIEMVPPKNEVAVPATAIVERGESQVLFVQPAEKDTEYVERQVALSRRAGRTVFLRGEVTAADRQRGVECVRVGERVVSSGAVQLLSILNDLRSDAASRPQSH